MLYIIIIYNFNINIYILVCADYYLLRELIDKSQYIVVVSLKTSSSLIVINKDTWRAWS